MIGRTYATTNLWFVASMLTYGVAYPEVKVTEKGWKEFIFIENPEFEQVKADYFSGRLNIPALQMEAMYKQILDVAKKE